MTTEPTAKHQEEAQQVVRLWCADTFDSMKNGECMQSPPGSMTSLTNRIAAALSSRDTEIREVLEGLRDDDSGCWCVHFGSEYHTNACLAARGLWERLQS